MEKYRLPRPIYAMWGVIFGVSAANFIHTAADDSAERIEKVQTNNETIERQLEEPYPGLSDLVLSDEEKTYKFTFTNNEGMIENCEGNYEVNEDIAHAVGEVACTITTQLQDK